MPIKFAIRCNQTCSLNWRADWACYSGKTYAQVLKSKPVRQELDIEVPKQAKGLGVFNSDKTVTNVSWQGQQPVSIAPVRPPDKKCVNRTKTQTNVNSKAASKDCFQIALSNRFLPIATQQRQFEAVTSQNQWSKNTNKNDFNSQTKAVKTQSTPNKANNKGEERSGQNMAQQAPIQKENKCQKTSKAHSGKNFQGEDKYDLELHTTNKNKMRIARAKQDYTYKLWSDQNPDKFGFIPLGPLVLPNTDRGIVMGPDPVLLYDAVKSQKQYNFLSSQVIVHSQLKYHEWEKRLGNYWDQQLLYLIKYGFPLDFDTEATLESNHKSHYSAVAFPEDIEKYINEEIEFQAIFGPYDIPPIQNLHVSPLMTREKPGATHRRVIMDLSYPQGRAVNSNISKDKYLGTDFVLTLPSIDNITEKVKKFGKGSLLYKIDISHAFRHVKIDPRDYFLMGLKHKKYFLDTCLAFGFRHGSGIFQRLSDVVRYIMTSQGHDVINYIDDVIGFGTTSTADKSFKLLKNTLETLGFEISMTKLIQPSTRVTCLGVEVDTKNFTVAVPQEKLEKILATCQEWQHRETCNKKELQSLLGSLLYISKCVKNSRIFLNRMLDTLRCHNNTDKIALDISFHRDLNWFSKFLPQFNGRAFFLHSPVQATIELDACLQGLGAYCMNQVYAIQIPVYLKNYTIVHLEMLNILVTIRAWKNFFQNKRILIKCDNQAVVSVLTTGRTSDLTLSAIARNIMMETATYDIDLQVIHILGVENKIADLLSRWYITPNPHIRLSQFISDPEWLQLPGSIINIDWSI